MSKRFLNGLPSMYLWRLSTKISVSFSFSSSTVLAEWGLIMTSGMSHRGLSGASGSMVVTFSAAPPRWPDWGLDQFRLVHDGALAILMRTEPSFILVSSSIPIKPLVSSVSGQIMIRKSDLDGTGSRSS